MICTDKNLDVRGLRKPTTASTLFLKMLKEKLYRGDFNLFSRTYCFKGSLFIFSERGREGEGGRETSRCGCLSLVPYWGPDPQPRHVP